MTGSKTVPENASAAASATPPLRGQFLRPAVDAVAAFAVFAIASLTLASAPSSASPTGVSQFVAVPAPAQVRAVTNPGGGKTLTFVAGRRVETAAAAASQSSRQAAWSILGLGFSLLAAMNLAFFRHLRQAYAKPRKRPNLG